jgi:hypothetical protein
MKAVNCGRSRDGVRVARFLSVFLICREACALADADVRDAPRNIDFQNCPLRSALAGRRGENYQQQ